MYVCILSFYFGDKLALETSSMDWINDGFYFGFILVINQLRDGTSGMDWIYGNALVGHLDCRWLLLCLRMRRNLEES